MAARFPHQQVHPPDVRRVEVWTSIHHALLTPGLRVRQITHHTDVPGWDERYLYIAQWSEDNLRWELQPNAKGAQSSVTGLEETRCVGATINVFDPTRGLCGAPKYLGYWVECSDGTLCRAEHAGRARRPSDWVHWEDNTFGRRAMGMYHPVEE